ncbi:MAG: CsbD family protein [Pseudomonadota bacterium]|nr:CsbD family protein [Pseudomonadota bacterium]
MSNLTDRGEGMAEELGGAIKKNVGKLIGNEQMELEGKVKEMKGQARQEVAKASERTKGKVEEVVGAVKNRVGAVIDNEQMQVEGKLKEIKGQARQDSNK